MKILISKISHKTSSSLNKVIESIQNNSVNDSDYKINKIIDNLNNLNPKSSKPLNTERKNVRKFNGEVTKNSVPSYKSFLSKEEMREFEKIK